jgi:hypothetical protein
MLSGIILLLVMIGCSQQASISPILILAAENDFGTYTGEILKAEGFNEFIIASLNSEKISNSFLSGFDFIILSEPLTDNSSLTKIRKYVKDGGNLIAFQPSGTSCELFGIEKVPGNISSSYISVDTSTLEGKSLRGRKMQIHVGAGKYSLKGAESIAWFSGNSIADNEYPAIVRSRSGKGRTAAFLYDLPRNIVYTRQGDPGLAGIEKDDIPGLRAMDLFTDGWVDTTANIINQADEQMTLLSYCIEYMTSCRKPLPRLWYFPDTLKCLVTLTNDGEFKGESDFETQFSDVDSMGARMSLYVLETDKVTKRWTDRWTERGFEISGHPDDTREAAGPVWKNMENVLKNKIKDISSLYGIRMSTVVNHWFVWCGNDVSGGPEFAAQAEIEAGNGLELDINYAHYDNNSSQGHFLGPGSTLQGNFTGSGLPMRFALSTGKILNIYQHLNNVYDQQYTENHDPEGFFNCFKGLMDRSLYDDVYSFISIKSHNDEYYFSKVPLMKMLAYANTERIPVWTAAELLDFIKVRDEARFTGISWSDNDLVFNLNSSIRNTNGLSFIVPLRNGDVEIKTITIDGNTAPFIIRIVKGFKYVLSTVEPGTDHSILVRYGK